MTTINRRLTVAVLALALSSAAAHAQPINRNDGRVHDPGNFFMRLSAGFGFSGASFDDATETSLSGGGGMASLAFGATVGRNIALHADLFGLSIIEPDVELNGRGIGDADNTRATLAALGVGATFYVMPLNLYFAGAVGAGVGTVETRVVEPSFELHIKEDSKVGLAVNLMIGKEWWVSRRWGIGLAGQVIFAALQTDKDVDLGVFGIGLLFSATMN